MISKGIIVSINGNSCRVRIDNITSGECSFCHHINMIDIKAGRSVLVFFLTGYENGYILGVVS